MIGEAKQAVPIAVGEVLEVIYRENLAIFLRVGLRHYRTDDRTPEGAPLEATVRWAPNYHGVDGNGAYGDWHWPDTGADVLCKFPGASPSGAIGDDLDNGFAFAYVSSKPEPPVNQGLAGTLSPTRKIYKGKLGVHHDDTIQADRDWQVDGNKTGTVKGNVADSINGTEDRTVDLAVSITHKADSTLAVNANRSVTIDGTENRETKGVFEWLFRAAVDFLGDVAMKIKSTTTLNLEGVTKVNVDSGTEILLTVGTSTLSIKTGQITLDSPIVRVEQRLWTIGKADMFADFETHGDAQFGQIVKANTAHIGQNHFHDDEGSSTSEPKTTEHP